MADWLSYPSKRFNQTIPGVKKAKGETLHPKSNKCWDDYLRQQPITNHLIWTTVDSILTKYSLWQILLAFGMADDDTGCYDPEGLAVSQIMLNIGTAREYVIPLMSSSSDCLVSMGWPYFDGIAVSERGFERLKELIQIHRDQLARGFVDLNQKFEQEEFLGVWLEITKVKEIVLVRYLNVLTNQSQNGKRSRGCIDQISGQVSRYWVHKVR
jgi:hypothetical protein